MTVPYGLPPPERVFTLIGSTLASWPIIRITLPIRTVSATTTLTTSCRIVTATCGSPLPAAGLTVTARKAMISRTLICRKTVYPVTAFTRYSNHRYKKDICCWLLTKDFQNLTIRTRSSIIMARKTDSRWPPSMRMRCLWHTTEKCFWVVSREWFLSGRRNCIFLPNLTTYFFPVCWSTVRK